MEYVDPGRSTALLIMSLSIALYIFYHIAKEWRLRRKAKKWKGAVVSYITDIKRAYRYFRFSKHWYEYPVVSYEIEGETFCQEYRRAAKRCGRYKYGQKVLLIYNQENPREFAIKDEFKAFSYYASQVLQLAFFLFWFYGSMDCVASYYLDTHELLWENETWRSLETSFDRLKIPNFHIKNEDLADTWYSEVKRATAHFREVEALVENTSGKKYDTYRSRYHQAAIAAAASLGNLYSETAGTFLEECGVEGEKEKVYQSAVSGFLEEVCPAALETSGPYSMEELIFLVDCGTIAGYQYNYCSIPEEDVGISLGVCYAKLQATMETMACSSVLRETIEASFPGCMIRSMNLVDDYYARCRKNSDTNPYPPLDRTAVQQVYQYMMDRYRGTESFPTTLWESTVYAKRQIDLHLEEAPDMQKWARYASLGQDLLQFDDQMGEAAFLESDYDHLLDWYEFVYNLTREEPL